MDKIMNLLYMVVIQMISVWKMFTWVIIQLMGDKVRDMNQKIYAKGDIALHEEFEDDNQNPQDTNGSMEKVKKKKVKNPWDITVYNKNFYKRLAQDGTLGKGESYMEKWWDCERLDELFYRIFRRGLYRSSLKPFDQLIHYLQFDLFNLQTAARSYEVGEKHYDLGNEFFANMLDKSMNYTCGYWREAKNLDEAQLHKMQLIGRKLDLKPGMKILEFGCGYGSLAKYLAETYKVSVVACTISKEQGKYAQALCKDVDVDVQVIDYRILAENLTEEFDRVVTVGIMEHIGRSNYLEFFKIAHRCLKDHGIFLVHTIGIDNTQVPPIEPFFNTYIFPNGILPNHTHIPETAQDLFTIEDWHNFGFDYSKTLTAWHSNFVKNWPSIKHLCTKDPEKFYRMWEFYLLLCVGAFRSRRYQLWQIILSKNGIPNGYVSVR